MRTKRRLRSQPRIPGLRRLPQSVALEPRIMERVVRESRRFGVSRSYIAAVALADTWGIELDGEYRYDAKG